MVDSVWGELCCGGEASRDFAYEGFGRTGVGWRGFVESPGRLCVSSAIEVRYLDSLECLHKSDYVSGTRNESEASNLIFGKVPLHLLSTMVNLW